MIATAQNTKGSSVWAQLGNAVTDHRYTVRTKTPPALSSLLIVCSWLAYSLGAGHPILFSTFSNTGPLLFPPLFFEKAMNVACPTLRNPKLSSIVFEATFLTSTQPMSTGCGQGGWWAALPPGGLGASSRVHMSAIQTLSSPCSTQVGMKQNEVRGTWQS